MPFGRKSPLEALALPGVILAYKYSQFRQRRREAASRRVTERELSALHHKIDKLLSKLEESEPDPPTSQEDECVICINARATMQTSPCGHRVVCRRCFVKTIQSAVAQRLLPLRCVICRARVNRLTSTSGTTFRLQESASSYSMGAKSWTSATAAAGMPTSASSYSMGDAGHSFYGSRHQPHHLHHSQYPRSPNSRVAQSASLYSMSSTGSSSISGISHASNYSKTSSISSSAGLCSLPSSPISPASTNSYTPTTTSILNNHLAPPGANANLSNSASLSLSPSGSGSGCSGISSGSLSPREHHSHRAGCPSGCSGAIPRKPLSSSLSNGGSNYIPNNGNGNGNGHGNVNFSPLSPQTYPGRRHTKGRIMDLQNRLPPIKEFRSPAKVPHPSPVHISNPRFRYASYTKSTTNGNETAPLLREPPSPPKKPMNIQVNSSIMVLAPPPLKACSGGAKISPLTNKNSLPKNAYLAPAIKDKKPQSNTSKGYSKVATTAATGNNNNNNTKSCTATNNNNNSNKKSIAHDANANLTNLKALNANCSKETTLLSQKQKTSSSNMAGGTKNCTGAGNTMTSRTLSLFSSNNNQNEKAENRKNESVERKKKEEKLKLKAEKEARKVGGTVADELTIRNNEKKIKNDKKIVYNDNDDNTDGIIDDSSTDKTIEKMAIDDSRSRNRNRSRVGLMCFYGGLAIWKSKSEEKRLAKEEERLAKIIAKEEKKKGKKEAKELLLANDGNSKK